MDKEQFRHYEVGVPIIDAEHFRIINILENLRWKGTDRELVIALVEELQSFIEDHFKNEEAYMRSIEFPFRKSHEERHREMLRIINLKINYFIAAPSASMELIVSELNKILFNHIDHYDRQFGDYGKSLSPVSSTE